MNANTLLKNPNSNNPNNINIVGSNSNNNIMNKTMNSEKGVKLMNTSNSSAFKTKNMNEYNEMDVNRIREFIIILEEHQIKCEKSRKFVDAEIAKQKVAQLKQVEKEKVLSDMKLQHEEEINTFEIQRNSAFMEFNTEWDKNYTELMDKFAEFEEKLKVQQQEDLNSRVIDFDKKFCPIVKPTSEILNLTKILNGLIRQKEYIKAHQIQDQINKLSEFDSSQYAMEKEKRLQKEVEKIRQRHFQEYQVLVAKKELAESEYAKNRQLEFDKLVQGFKNRQREIQLKQSFDLMQITNPKKYLARNLNRSSSQAKMHSSFSMEKIKTDKNTNNFI